MIISKLNSIDSEIQLKIKELNISNRKPEIIAVSKTFGIDEIMPLINHGHINFGENKVQESIEKWTKVKVDFKNIKLHMLGKIQTNKTKQVVDLFDYIHSLDSKKLAEKISKEQEKKKKNLKIFIQVNIANEIQKAGISIENLNDFYNYCVHELKLNIIGLMCLPPNEEEPDLYFKKMIELKDILGVKELSMGMSGDYLKAVIYGSTFVRIGSKIFGQRY
ncbi:YggS family pyridoxal phosphate-dependent enzyme [Candidatus Pelagibacter sp.]|nr:YggS family pyridoxal phosphate-dependent enzyme [Candidatus Pelagibacter sp.]